MSSMSATTASQQSAARVAGIALIAGMAVVMFGEFYLSRGLYVAGDAVQTAANILAHETRFRFQLLCNLFYGADILVLMAALYLIFKPVGQGLALAALLMRLVFALMWSGTALNMLGALSYLGDAPYLHAVAPESLQVLARVSLRQSYYAYYVGLPFWAIASTLCCWQWLKSGYIPKGLAGFGLLSSAWCAFCGAVFLAFPHFNEIVNDWFFDSFMALFELILGVWLLVKGLRQPR